MDLTDEQQEALTALTDQFEDPETFAEALNDTAQPYFQEIWGRGHSTATGKKNEDIEDLEGQLEELRGKVASKEQELEKARKDQPDLEELRQSWEEEELQPWKEKYQDLQSNLKQSKRETVESRLISELEEQGVDKDFAKYFVRQEGLNRVQISDDGQEVNFVRPDGQTPYGTTNGQDPSELFAQDLAQSVPDKFKTDQRKSGSGFQKGGGDGGGQRSGEITSKADFQQIAAQKGISEAAAKAHYIGEHGQDAYAALPDSTE